MGNLHKRLTFIICVLTSGARLYTERAVWGGRTQTASNVLTSFTIATDNRCKAGLRRDLLSCGGMRPCLFRLQLCKLHLGVNQIGMTRISLVRFELRNFLSPRVCWLVSWLSPMTNCQVLCLATKFWQLRLVPSVGFESFASVSHHQHCCRRSHHPPPSRIAQNATLALKAVSSSSKPNSAPI